MRKKRDLDKQKVVQAAIDLCDEVGIDGLTLPALAKKLDIRSQSLYHYVSGRKELLSLIGAQEVNRLKELLTTEIVGKSGKDAIITFSKTIREFILENKALAAVLYHLNEYEKDDAIVQAILDILKMAEQMNINVSHKAPTHVLIGAVLGYIFLDASTLFTDETEAEAEENYYDMIFRIIQ
ncbi:MAG: TetR family transcriptional regulator [Lactobacillus sp.]|nr:TetR family transcriptional regulator [Lactobacillus sp.]